MLTWIAIVAAVAGVPYTPQPSSQQPVFLADGRVRFLSNLDARTTGQNAARPFVVRVDGSGLAPATDAEVAEPAAAPPASPRLDVDELFGTKIPLYAVDATSRRRVVTTGVDAIAGFALSPDGSTAVFGQEVGWAYDEGFVLYAVRVDGTEQPRRLTPTPCTLDSATHSALTGRCIDGTDGADRLAGTRGGDIVIAGSGADAIRAGDGQNVIESQWGDDDIRSGSGPDTVWAGGGDDTIRTGAGRDVVHPGPGHDAIAAGSGNDAVIANDGVRDVIDCGPGVDGARVDSRDVVRNCENVNRTRAASDDAG